MPDPAVQVEPPAGHCERLVPDPHIAELRRSGHPSPNVSLRAADNCRAARLGTHSSSAATLRTRARVAAETPGWLFSAYDTAPWETPQRLAISLMVTRATTNTPHGGRTADKSVRNPPVCAGFHTMSSLRRGA